MAKSAPREEQLDLSVDELRLCEECKRQIDLCLSWGRKHAEAVYELDRAKANLEVVKAESDGVVREAASAAGKKTTEAAIASAILASSAYQVALEQTHKAKRNVNLLDSVVTSIEHRKRMIDNIIQMEMRAYFAEPKGPGNRQEWQEELKRRRVRKKGVREDADRG
jgi:hypothetical protein